jgi:outer membrane protein TolC
VTLSGSEAEGHPYGPAGKSSSYGVSVTQPLWKGFGTDVGMHDIRAARLNKLISRGNLELSLQSTIFQIRNAYATCIQQLASLDVQKSAVESARTFLKLTQARERAGQQTKLDVYNAEVQLADRELSLASNEHTLATAFDNLKSIMDVDLTEQITVEEEPMDFGDKPKPPEGEERVIVSDATQGTVRLATRRGGQVVGEPKLLFQAQRFDDEKILADALSNRIELLNGKRNLALQELNRLLALNGLGQEVDLTAGYGRSGTGRNWSDSHSFGDHDYSIGVNYRVAWGKVQDKAAFEKALLVKEQAEIQLKQVRSQVHEGVRELLRTLRETEKIIVINGNKVEQAKRLLAAEIVRFERGLKDSFDVITAENNLLAAKNDFINRKVGYVVLLAQLELVVGKPTGRVDLKAKTIGGQIESRAPETLTPDRRPTPAPMPDTKLDDRY